MNAIRQKLTGNLAAIWQRLLQANIPPARGYLALVVLVLLCFALSQIYQGMMIQQRLAAVRDDPNSLDAHEQLYDLYAAYAWTKSGQATFRKLAAEDKQNPYPLYELAWMDHTTRLSRGMSDESLESADRAMELTSNSRVLLSLAKLYYNLGEYDRSARAAQKALTTNMTDTSQAHFWAGYALLETGDRAGAERQFQLGATQIVSDVHYVRLSQAALISTTREVTITLRPDHLTIQTRAQIDNPPDSLREFLAQQTSPAWVRYPFWGLMMITQRGRWIADLAQPTTHIQSTPASLIVADSGERIDYRDLWLADTWWQGAAPAITLRTLPPLSPASPMTVTVISSGTQVLSTSLAYLSVPGGLAWSLTGDARTPSTLTWAVELDKFNQFKLPLEASYSFRQLAKALLYALPGLWGLVVFALARRKRSAATPAQDEPALIHLFHPPHLLSWLFDAALMILSIWTVCHTLWLTIMQPSPNAESGNSYNAYLWVLVVLLGRLALSQWSNQRERNATMLHLGAVVFAAFLAVHLFSYSLWGIGYVLACVAGYYLVLTHKWVDLVDWQKVRKLFGPERGDLIGKIALLSQVPDLENTMQAQDMTLAKGQLKPADYKESRTILTEIVQQRKDQATKLRAELGLPEDGSLNSILLSLGPQATPLRNGLVAVLFGLIPYLAFTVLTVLGGGLSLSYTGGYNVLRLMDLVRDLFGVAWGPLYLFFFGYMFVALRGNSGATKGLLFSLVLIVLCDLFRWLWLSRQVDGVELWGTTVRTVVTFVFTGVMMDWMTIGFSWRRLKQLYDSPAVTTVFTIVGTAATTIAAGLITGTLHQLSSSVLQQIAGAALTLPIK